MGEADLGVTDANKAAHEGGLADDAEIARLNRLANCPQQDEQFANCSVPAFQKIGDRDAIGARSSQMSRRGAPPLRPRNSARKTAMVRVPCLISTAMRFFKALTSYQCGERRVRWKPVPPLRVSKLRESYSRAGRERPHRTLRADEQSPSRRRAADAGHASPR